MPSSRAAQDAGALLRTPAAPTRMGPPIRRNPRLVIRLWAIAHRQAALTVAAAVRPVKPGAEAVGSATRGGLARSAVLLVLLDGLLQIRVLRAGEEAQRVELGQVLLGVGQVVQREIRLTDVLVGAAVLGIERQSLLVDPDGLGGVAVLARGIGQPVVGIGVGLIAGDDRLEQRDRIRVLLRLDGPDAGGVLRIRVLGGNARRLGSAGAAVRACRRRQGDGESQSDESDELQTRHAGLTSRRWFRPSRAAVTLDAESRFHLGRAQRKGLPCRGRPRAGCSLRSE